MAEVINNENLDETLNPTTEPNPLDTTPCTYMKRGIGVVDYSFTLDPESYQVGYTYEDYLDNAWVVLTEEHKAFRAEHPGCSPREMFNLEMNPVYEPTEEELLNRARSNKLNQISHYDTSTNVNSFYLNSAQVWLDKSMRVGLMNSMEIEKATGREVSTLWFGNVCYTVPIELGIQMLQALELYALACYNKTAEHKVNVQSLETIQEIEDYDHTIGYPEKLVFDTAAVIGA